MPKESKAYWPESSVSALATGREAGSTANRGSRAKRLRRARVRLKAHRCRHSSRDRRRRTEYDEGVKIGKTSRHPSAFLLKMEAGSAGDYRPPHLPIITKAKKSGAPFGAPLGSI